jgi:hypothetical protein
VFAAALARERTKSAWATVVFGLGFLLSPSAGAAALSDFHTTALAATFLMVTLFFLATNRRRSALVTAGLTALAREDAAVLVAMVGLYLVAKSEIWRIRSGRYETGGDGADRDVWPSDAPSRGDPMTTYGRIGLFLLIGSLLWAALAVGVIAPFFNGTIGMLRRGQPLVGSVFWDRYGWLGATPLVGVENVVLRPGRWIGWLLQRDVLAYFATLVLSGGIVALAAPSALAIAVPVALENALSSFAWARSGGAHYSVMIVPIMVYAGIEGSRVVSRWLGRRLLVARRNPGLVNNALLGVAFAAMVANHVWLQASPLVPGFQWTFPDRRDATIAALLERIPAGATVSATSGIYPHLATRPRAYWFPAVNDAEFLALDVAGRTDPIAPAEVYGRVQDLLASGDYGVDTAAPGFLLLQRGAGSAVLPDAFYDFLRARPSEMARATRVLAVQFGPVDRGVVLDAYRVQTQSALTVFGPSALLTTYWHVTDPSATDLGFTFYLTRRSDGAIVGVLKDQGPEPFWYPTTRWRPGEEIAVRIQIPDVERLQAVGVSLIDPATNRPITIVAGPGRVLWDDGAIARIAVLNPD